MFSFAMLPRRHDMRPKQRRAQRRRDLRPRPGLEALEGRALLSHAQVPAGDVTALARRPRVVQFYAQTNLVADKATTTTAAHYDSNLINPWGLVASSTSPFWVSDNRDGLSTLYKGDGTPLSLVVKIPPPTGQTVTAAPDGIVFNGTSGFVVSANGKSGSAAFIFATEDGTISGWSPKVNATNAIIAVDNSAGGTGAVYKGLAMASTSTGTNLYATNFRAGTVDVFDSSFQPVTLGAGAFHDKKVAKGFAPFGITNLGGDLLVSFAKQNAQKHNDVAGRGNGFVDLFDPSGNLITRIASRGQLDSPWGMAVAPSNFGKFSGDLLVGNFGNGHVSAYRQVGNRAVFAGQLSNAKGKPIVIDDLWGLMFGNGSNGAAKNALYFTAGSNDQQDGTFGTLTAQTSG